LDEAAEHWSRRVPGPLRSGPWSERGSDGLERTFEAQALYHAGRRLLVIERLGADFEQLQQSLQLARTAELNKQRVGLLTAALVGRGLAHRPADSGAESTLLIEPDGRYRDLGVSSAAAEPQQLSDWLEPHAAAALMQRVKACIRERRHHAVLCTMEADDGARHFEARLLPFGDGRALALVREVTRRIHLETELVRRAETLRGLEENVFRLLDEIETAAWRSIPRAAACSRARAPSRRLTAKARICTAARGRIS
jgi:hypothetical protein